MSKELSISLMSVGLGNSHSFYESGVGFQAPMFMFFECRNIVMLSEKV